MMGISKRAKYLRSWVLIDKARDNALKFKRCWTRKDRSVRQCLQTFALNRIYRVTPFRRFATICTRRRVRNDVFLCKNLEHTLDKRVERVESSQMVAFLHSELPSFQFGGDIAFINEEYILRSFA